MTDTDKRTAAVFCKRIQGRDIIVSKPEKGNKLYVQGETPPRQYHIEKGSSSKDRHLVAKCLHSEIVDGKIFYCDFSQRIKRLYMDESMQTHNCKEHLKERTFGSLTKKLPASNGEIPPLPKLLAFISGNLNISINSAVSKPVRDLAEAMYSLGQVSPHKAFRDAVQWPSRYIVRNTMVEMTKACIDESVRIFQDSPYISCAIDEGTTMGRKYVNFVIHDVRNKVGEYFVDSEILEGTGTALQYVPPIVSGLEKVASLQLQVGSIVSDGCTAQLKALGSEKGMVRDTLAAKAEDDVILSRYIVFPCACHLMNNIYEAWIKGSMNKDLDQFVTGIRNISQILRHSGDKDLKVCPSHVTTRWLYDANIIRFITDNRTKVREYLIRQGIEFDWTPFTLYGRLIYMLRAITDDFESANVPASMVWPKIFTLCSDLLAERDKISASHRATERKRIVASLVSLLNNRFLKEGIFCLAFILTPLGRLWIKQLPERRGFPVTNTYQFREQHNSDIDAFDREVEALLNSQSDQQSADALATDQQPEVPPDEETYVFPSAAVHFGNWRTMTTEVMKEISQIVITTKDEDYQTRRQNLTAAFQAFISSAHSPLTDALEIIPHRNLYNWETISEHESYKDLADVALRLQPTPASEASAERAISLQRLVMVARRNQALQELVDARIALMRVPNEGEASKHVDLEESMLIARLDSSQQED